MPTRFLVLLSNLLPQSRNGYRLRRQLLLLAGMRLARKVVILAPLRTQGKETLKRISIGPRTFLNSGARLDASGGLTIGSFVQIGPDVALITSTHPVNFTPGRSRPTITKPIVVEDHVWIGSGATILPGVTIGRGSVVAAGALVTRDVPPLTVVGGIPARPLKRVEELSPANPTEQEPAPPLVGAERDRL